MENQRVVLLVAESQLCREIEATLSACLEATVETTATLPDALEAVERRDSACLVLSEPALDDELPAVVDSVASTQPGLPLVLLHERPLDDVTEDVSLSAFADVRTRDAVAADPRCLCPTLRRVTAAPTGGTLADIRERWRGLLDQDIVGVYTVEDGRFTFVNDRLAEMFGTTPEELVGASMLDVVVPSDRDRVRERIHAPASGGEAPSTFTFRGAHPDSDTLSIEVSGTRIDGADGVAIAGVMLDVTERNTYERELQRLSQALEYAATGVYITDTDSVIQYVNPAFERITGYDRDEAVGATPEILNSGQMDEEYFDRLYRTLEAGEVWEESIIDQRKNGEFYHAYQTITPYKTPDGETAGYVAIHSDITESRIQQQVLQVFQRLFRHNLRNKLTVIHGHLDVIRPVVTGTAAEASVEEIDEAAERLDSLSRKTTRVTSALESAEEKATTDLVTVLRRERETVESQYPDVTVTLDTPPAVTVEGGTELEVVVNELLTNAIVHCDHDEPEISVTLTADGEQSTAVLEIRDNGPGITDVQLDALAAGEETQLVHTEGIGLWLVEWVLTSLGGDVGFANASPRGLTVTLTLPLA